MENNDLWKELHIGRMIKETALQQNVSSIKIAKAIGRYVNNESKIFKLDDMYVIDLQKISVVLKVNLLELISKKYLSHIPVVGYNLKKENFAITCDLSTNIFKINIINAFEPDLKKPENIGKYIAEIVEKKALTQNFIASKIGRTQGLINHVFKRDYIKVKPLIKLSNILSHNLIAEFYLIDSDLKTLLHLLDDCEIRLSTRNPQEGLQSNEGVFSIILKPQQET